MQVGVLGELVVTGDDGPIRVTGTRLRRLLVRLTVDADRVVPMSELVDAVWPDDPPADTVGAVQTLVSRLRRALGDPGLVQQTHGGYRLAIPLQDTDIDRFRHLARDGSAELATGDAVAARSTLREALSLWRGPALLDADGVEYAAALTARLEQERLDALAARIEADLVAGDTGDTTDTRDGTPSHNVVPELEDLTHALPLDERFAGLLLRALAAGGRTAEALQAYERVRETLADTLGADPGPALQELHLALLRSELAPPAGRGVSPTGGARRSHLRVGLTSFLGRERDLARVSERLEIGRLVTVLGPGGAGKTRLSQEVARQWDADGRAVAIIELAPVTEPAAVVQAFLTALDVREAHVMDRARETRRRADEMDLLVAALDEAETLVVVDNCEHLLDVTARLVEDLLTAVPGLRVLATSREPLGVDGEAVCVLPPLALPPWEVPIEQALEFPSVQLFVERAGPVSARPVLDAQTLPAVVEIVRRLDGLPLAIELAAARTRVLPVTEIAARLGDRFRLLTGGRRTALPRHQTLRAVVEWSWDLLTGPERLLAERLAVFPAGATATSATTVCADERLPAADIPALLDSLVDKSLLALDPAADLRYRMLETIREFGAEQLTERGEVEDVRRRHAAYFGELVKGLSAQLRGHGQVAAAHVLESERDNVLGAIRFLGDSGEAAATLDLVLDLCWYWSLLDNNAELVTWVGFALGVEPRPGALPPPAQDVAVARAMADLTRAFLPGPSDTAATQALFSTVSQELALVPTGAGARPEATVIRTALAMFSDQPDLASEVIERGLLDDDPWVRAVVRMFRAEIAENAGDVEQMRIDVPVALAQFAELGDRWGLAAVLGVQAQLQVLDGDLKGAIASYERAGDSLDALGAAGDAAMTALRRASLRIRLGDYGTAREELATLTGQDGDGFARLFGAILRASLAVAERDEPAMRQLRDELSHSVRLGGSATQFQDHGVVMIFLSQITVGLTLGDLEAAATLLREVHPIALGTKDMPLIAATGVVTAALAHALGRPDEAATLLGVAASVRGAEDPTDLLVRDLLVDLPAELGDAGFADAYGRGVALLREEALARLDPALLPLPAQPEPGQARRR